MGVLAVNADGFAAPQAGSLKPSAWLFPNTGLSAFSYWVMDTFFHDKFLTLFSMLFGISLFLVGGELSDRRKGKILARRLVILFFFGMLHGFGIWWGDILSLYAATGAIMFFLRSLRPRVLLTLGVSIYLVMAVSDLPWPAPAHSSAKSATAIVAAAASTPSVSAKRRARVAHDVAIASSSWSGAYEVNTREYLNLLRGDVSLIPQTLALMMIGLGLFKTGFFAGRSSKRTYRMAVLSGLPALACIGVISWQTNVLGLPFSGEHGLMLLLSPLVSLCYAAGLVLLLRGPGGGALAPLAATGRMAFTNYLTQSIIMTSIFYGGRGGLMGQIDRPGLWLITCLIWAVQLIWSPLWLARFENGPFEWVWRCLTLGRRVPFRKTSSPAAA